jgi:hypothetical protein
MKKVNILGSQIDFLHENNMIKKISSIKIWSKSISNFFTTVTMVNV